jgi:hypothetical protein
MRRRSADNARVSSTYFEPGTHPAHLVHDGAKGLGRVAIDGLPLQTWMTVFRASAYVR